MKELRPLMEKHGFSFSKTLGQNFLINPDVPVRIAENAGLDENTTVIEIGPGVGCLTKELSARAKEVFAIEIDQRLIPVLSETLADCDNVTVINKDVLKTDLSALCEGKERVCICANLPYYITTPIIMALLEQRLPLSRITVMIQKEVAQRFSAKTGISKAEIEKAVTDCGFEPTVRAERLSVTDFAALSDRLITQ